MTADLNTKLALALDCTEHDWYVSQEDGRSYIFEHHEHEHKGRLRRCVRCYTFECEVCGWSNKRVGAWCFGRENGPSSFDVIDWSIVPVIDSAIRERGWTWRKYTRFAAIFTPTDQFRSAPSETANYDFPVALVEAFIAAKESERFYLAREVAK